MPLWSKSPTVAAAHRRLAPCTRTQVPIHHPPRNPKTAHQTRPTRPSASPRRPPTPFACINCSSRSSRPFHSSSRLSSETLPNHYDALHLSPDASPADVKRQFYALSKTHHPDRNPNDPTATTRFVAISDAYHTLSDPAKRAQYDAHMSQRDPKRWGGVWRGASEPRGSYSSASFAGSRPPSGLNRKRSTFRGPPPSFYKSGGYGTHGAKRAEYAHHQHEGAKTERKSAGDESYGGFKGFGPGQSGQGNEVPHFNDRRHKETHDQVHHHIHAKRRQQRPSDIPDDDSGGQFANFVLVACAVAFIAWSGNTLQGNTEKSKDKM